MDSCFFNLEDEVTEHERRAVRMHLRRLANATNDIKEINDVLRQENTTREAEDLDVLDTVIETQGLLQKNIITTFGKETDVGGGMQQQLDNNNFKKLNKRMSKKSSSKSSSGAGKKDFRWYIGAPVQDSI